MSTFDRVKKVVVEQLDVNADEVTAEPKMDDLLASIRRAIHDEGLDLAETGKGTDFIVLTR